MEYRQGFTHCAECQVELVDEPPDPADVVDPFVMPPEEEEPKPLIATGLVEVYRVGRVDAEVMRSLLEGHGIPAVTDNHGGGLYPVTVGALGGGGVYVQEENEDDALALIDAALNGELELVEDAPTGPDLISLSWFRSPIILRGLAFIIAVALVIIATQ